MACGNCGCNRFTAKQICRVNVIVDDTNTFLDNQEPTMHESIYDAENPFGEYTCVNCYETYDSLPKYDMIKVYRVEMLLIMADNTWKIFTMDVPESVFDKLHEKYADVSNEEYDARELEVLKERTYKYLKKDTLVQDIYLYNVADEPQEVHISELDFPRRVL